MGACPLPPPGEFAITLCPGAMLGTKLCPGACRSGMEAALDPISGAAGAWTVRLWTSILFGSGKTRGVARDALLCPGAAEEEEEFPIPPEGAACMLPLLSS